MEQDNQMAADPAVQSPLPEGWLEITSMDLDAQGVARKPDGKVVFIDGALPGERVQVLQQAEQWLPVVKSSGATL